MDIRAWLDDTVYQQPPETVFEDEAHAREARRPRASYEQPQADRLQQALSSYIYPEQYRQVSPSEDAVRPEAGRYRAAEDNLWSSSHHELGYADQILQQHETPDPYKRKPRRKTRPDRYEIKHKKDRIARPRKRKQHDASRYEDPAAGRIRNSLALKARPSKRRLTLRTTGSFGLFRHGKVSGGQVGVPDLTFHDMAFLRDSRERNATEQDELPALDPSQQHADDEHISAYFNPTRRDEDDQHIQHAPAEAHVSTSTRCDDRPAPVNQRANTDSMSDLHLLVHSLQKEDLQHLPLHGAHQASRLRKISLGEDPVALETTPARQRRLTRTLQTDPHVTPSAVDLLRSTSAPLRDTDADLLDLIIGSKRTQPHSHTPEGHTADILDVSIPPEGKPVDDRRMFRRPSSDFPAWSDKMTNDTAAIASNISSQPRRATQMLHPSRSQYDEQFRFAHLESPVMALPIRGLHRFDRAILPQQARYAPEPVMAVSKHQLWRTPDRPDSGSGNDLGWRPFSRDHLSGTSEASPQNTSFSHEGRTLYDSSLWTDGLQENAMPDSRPEYSIDQLWHQVKEHTSQDSAKILLLDTAQWASPKQGNMLSFKPDQGFWKPNCLY